jgi:uncharacterized Zn finger protein
MMKGRKRWEYKKPIKVQGGIKLRSTMSKRSRLNWWSRRWLDFIEGSIDSGRLARGRTYARRGQVLSVDVSPGIVSASVQGSRMRPYQVRLRFNEISADGKLLLLFRLRASAAFAASLLAGELPEEMADAFAECGAKLFPDAGSLNGFKCGCPDEAEPCKHIIAVLLILTEVFDDDPFLILKLRGMDREKLIDLLTAESGDRTYSDDGAPEFFDYGAPVITGGSEESRLVVCDAASAEKEKRESLKRWFTSEAPDIAFTAGEAKRRPAALELMNEFPLWRGEKTFKESLEVYYDRGAALAFEILTGEKRSRVGRPKKYF